jgi:hypothetical protein
MPSLLSSSFGEKAETPGAEWSETWVYEDLGGGGRGRDDGLGPGSFLAGTSRRSEAAVGGPRAHNNRFFDEARSVCRQASEVTSDRLVHRERRTALCKPAKTM